MKSVPGPFAIAIGADQLTFSVRGDALPAVTLTVGGARTAADIAGELNAGFRALGLLTARVEEQYALEHEDELRELAASLAADA